MKTWRVELSGTITRDIIWREVDATTEAEVRAICAREKPNYIVRSVLLVRPYMDDAALGTAIRDLVWRIKIEGTPVRDYDAGYGGFTRYTAPWLVIDTAEADPDVGWPGRLVGEAAELIDASRIQAEEIGRLVRAEIKI